MVALGISEIRGVLDGLNHANYSKIREFHILSTKAYAPSFNSYHHLIILSLRELDSLPISRNSMAAVQSPCEAFIRAFAV